MGKEALLNGRVPSVFTGILIPTDGAHGMLPYSASILASTYGYSIGTEACGDGSYRLTIGSNGNPGDFRYRDVIERFEYAHFEVLPTTA